MGTLSVFDVEDCEIKIAEKGKTDVGTAGKAGRGSLTRQSEQGYLSAQAASGQANGVK